MTDGRAIAYSEREREFTFAKKGNATKNFNITTRHHNNARSHAGIYITTQYIFSASIQTASITSGVFIQLTAESPILYNVC